MQKIFASVFLCGLLLTLSCETDFEISAPYQEIVVVYSILNTNETTHYIRVSKAFLTEDNSIVYAANNDLSLKDAKVKFMQLDNSGNPDIVFQPLAFDTVKEQGAFVQNLTLFRMKGVKLDSTKTYKIQVTTPENHILESEIKPVGDMRVTRINPLNGNSIRWESVDKNGRGVIVNFIPSTNAIIYQMEVQLNYQEVNISTNDTVQKILVWKPGGLFSDNVGCNTTGGDLCYSFPPRGLIDFVNNELTDRAGKKFIALNTTIVIASGDKYLYDYMRINGGDFSSFQDNRPEYTNINGGYGLFSSRTFTYSTDPVSDSTKYYIGFE